LLPRSRAKVVFLKLDKPNKNDSNLTFAFVEVLPPSPKNQKRMFLRGRGYSNFSGFLKSMIKQQGLASLGPPDIEVTCEVFAPQRPGVVEYPTSKAEIAPHQVHDPKTAELNAKNRCREPFAQPPHHMR
jgi:hypothetical protein